MDLSSLTEITTAYAMALALVAFTAILFRTVVPKVFRRARSRPFARAFVKICPPLLVSVLRIRRYTLFSSRHIVVKFLRQNGIIQPWKLQDVFIFLSYFGANVACVFVAFPGLPKAGLRAGRLALVNLVVLYAGPHLSFLADILNVPLSTYRRIHLTVGLTVFILAIFHIVVRALDLDAFPLNVSQNLFALIVRR